MVKTTTEERVTVVENAAPVVRLRREGGLSFRAIAAATGVPRTTCHRRYQAALRALPPVRDIADYRAEVLADIEVLLQTLRPLVHGDEHPKPKDVAKFMTAIEAKVKLLGLAHSTG